MEFLFHKFVESVYSSDKLICNVDVETAYIFFPLIERQQGENRNSHLLLQLKKIKWTIKMSY